MKKLLVLHGPNLNRLGNREPSVYGTTALAEINAALEEQAKEAGFSLSCQQSNSEAELIDAIHQASDDKIDLYNIQSSSLYPY